MWRGSNQWSFLVPSTRWVGNHITTYYKRERLKQPTFLIDQIYETLRDAKPVETPLGGNVPTNWLISKLMPDFLSSVQLRLQDSGSKLNKRQGPILSERSSKPRTEISTVIGVVCFSQRFIIHCLENQFNVCIKYISHSEMCISKKCKHPSKPLVLKRCRSFQLPFERVLTHHDFS